MMNGKKRHDFDISFRKSVNALYKSDVSIEEKKVVVEEMLEGYYSKTGEYPSEAILEKLADVLLSDMLRDNDVGKLSKTEYPILSVTQVIRRVTGINRTDVPINEDEINYHANTMLSTYFIYKSPRANFRRKRKKIKFQSRKSDRSHVVL